MFIEATRRASRAATQKILNALVEYDQIVFTDVDMGPDEAFEIVRDQGQYVVALVDPTVGEFELDCLD